MQEDYAAGAFVDAHAEIYYSRQKVGELRQLVIVRREEHARLRVFLPLQKFDDGPCDAEAVVGRRAAAHFVQDDEASVRRVAQDVRCLDHLDHEGALPARELVARAYAREDAVYEADLRALGGDEGAHMRHYRNERRGAQVGGFSRHVRPRYERDAPPVLRAEVEVVGREGIFAERHLDDGMARVFHDEVLAHVERRARVAALRCNGGEREQHVERRYEVRRQLYFGGMSEHLADEPRVYALLYR